MALNFRLSYNAGTQFVDLFPRTGIQGVTDAGDVLNYSTISVTIPAVLSGTTQTISITTTETQVSAPVYMVLTSTGDQAEQDYATITQYQVQDNSLVLTRLYSFPKDSINVMLIFEEGGVQ